MISNRYVAFSILVLIIIIGGIVYFELPNLQGQGSAELTITSATAQSLNTNNTKYTLTIDLNIKFNGQMHFNTYAALSLCSFSLNLTSILWEVVPITCSVPPDASETFFGSDKFSLAFTLVPINKTTTSMPTSFNITFAVFSDQFNVVSPNYFLHVGNVVNLSNKICAVDTQINIFTQINKAELRKAFAIA